jgi:hypothetical protein
MAPRPLSSGLVLASQTAITAWCGRFGGSEDSRPLCRHAIGDFACEVGALQQCPLRRIAAQASKLL